MALLLAGLPYEIPGVTVNRLCGSGLEAVQYAARAIALGEGDVVLAGGVESMTRAPFVMAKAREAFDRAAPAVRHLPRLALPQPPDGRALPPRGMGETAENVAVAHAISREAQDAFASRRHQRAARAHTTAFAGEVVPVEVPQRKGPAVVVTRDESVRGDTTLAKLAKLAPVFRKGGTVTAGNSSPLNDGASAVLISPPEGLVARLGLAPMARSCRAPSRASSLGSWASDPSPRPARRSRGAGLSVGDLDTVELNEAFAAQASPASRARPRPRAGQPRRRGHRPRPPHRLLGRPRGGDARPSDAPGGPPPRPREPVHRRRSGHRLRDRARLSLPCDRGRSPRSPGPAGDRRHPAMLR
jgi:acetyl-CoA acyltransferase